MYIQPRQVYNIIFLFFSGRKLYTKPLFFSERMNWDPSKPNAVCWLHSYEDPPAAKCKATLMRGSACMNRAPACSVHQPRPETITVRRPSQRWLMSLNHRLGNAPSPAESRLPCPMVSMHLSYTCHIHTCITPHCCSEAEPSPPKTSAVKAQYGPHKTIQAPKQLSTVPQRCTLLQTTTAPHRNPTSLTRERKAV